MRQSGGMWGGGGGVKTGSQRRGKKEGHMSELVVKNAQVTDFELVGDVLQLDGVRVGCHQDVCSHAEQVLIRHIDLGATRTQRLGTPNMKTLNLYYLRRKKLGQLFGIHALAGRVGCLEGGRL